jgi:predicted nucleic acid-binding protein
MKTIVSDTSPLILLAKLALLDLVCSRWHWVVTEDVAWEATRRQDLPDAKYIQHLMDQGRIRAEKISAKKIHDFQTMWGLDRGESSALILARDAKALFATDDYQAMRMARTLNVPFTTTVFLILALRKERVLEESLAVTKLDALKQHGWIKENLIEEAKRLAHGG